MEQGGREKSSGTFGNDNEHCYRHHWARCLIALVRISLVIDVNMQSLQMEIGTRGKREVRKGREGR